MDAEPAAALTRDGVPQRVSSEFRDGELGLLREAGIGEKEPDEVTRPADLVDSAME
ncbi:hypothetical protein [Spongiactinospora gelatinilytica]|uniref:hypothetical protein n=1 Tax=Spongiactinospora gelatinilytica TaxID=2666298 RepID=UPI00131434E2|nr:hypothetical protein [Spongiactinospora gelatinilytica]